MVQVLMFTCREGREVRVPLRLLWRDERVPQIFDRNDGKVGDEGMK